LRFPVIIKLFFSDLTKI